LSLANNNDSQLLLGIGFATRNPFAEWENAMATDRIGRVRNDVWRMTARCVTALVGGYGAAAALASLVARLLPIAPVEATAWGMIFSFLLYASLGLWAFHEPRLGRVAITLWGSAALFVGILLLLGPRA
jgi:hypothetical protein